MYTHHTKHSNNDNNLGWGSFGSPEPSESRRDTLGPRRERAKTTLRFCDIASRAP